MEKQRTVTQKARNVLIGLLIIFLAMTGIVVALVATHNATWGPKLALDLEGGTQLILTASSQDGKAVTQEQMEQAKDIIEQRVNGAGVSETEVNIQGNNNIVVSIPGEVSQEQIQLIKASAYMEFRPVITIMQDPGQATGKQAKQNILTYVSKAKTPDKNNYSDPSWITQSVVEEANKFDCTKPQDPVTGDNKAKQAVAACQPAQKSASGQAVPAVKYILGPVEVPGADISNASANQETNSQGQTTGGWAVNLEFNSSGKEAFKKVTQRITSLQSPQNQFAIMLDGSVISAPASQAVISDGKAQITGNFTQKESTDLANQLKYGSLPVSFEISSSENISASLGDQQLQMGIIAGVIGLLLVAAYSVFQYRALAWVTISSLIVAGVFTYLAIVILGSIMNYRLSLAGIAGIIVSIGLTADSFIVYFERIRDELREGRGMVSAVEHGWDRAKRTILASKAVNLLASIVLYIVAVGNVQGFAFTLGLTAVADLIVVFMFTHPVMEILATTKFFGGGHPASGMDPRQLGAQSFYQGGGKFRTPGAQNSNSGSTRTSDRSQKNSSQLSQKSSTRKKASTNSVRSVDPELAELSIAQRRRLKNESLEKKTPEDILIIDDVEAEGDEK